MATTGADVGADSEPNVDWDVPPDEEPARCPRCGRPFRREQYRDLHLADHGLDSLTDLEREAHEAARDAEDDDLFLFHLKVVGALAILYAVLVLAYMVFGV
ncbi:MAG: hypothetical protein V5A61_14315 [Haloarculaceae archaeon]